MKKVTIKKQVLILCFSLLIIQGVIGLIGYSALTSVNLHLDTVFKKRLPSIDNLVQADRDFQQMLVAERSLLLENLDEKQKTKMFDDYKVNRDQVLSRFQKYKELGLSSKENKIADQFLQKYSLWLKESENDFLHDGKSLKIPDNKEKLIEQSLGSINLKFENARASLDELQELILQFGETEFQAAEKTYNSSITFILLFSIGSIFFSLGLGFLISRNIDNKITQVVKDMNQEGERLSIVSSSLGGKADSLSSVSQDLTSAVTETTSSLHEISQMIKNNTEGSSTVAQLIDTSKILVNDGVSFLTDLGRGIKGVEESSINLTTTVERSNLEFSEIVKVFEAVTEKTNVINDIVFQTKLLSFNASVEAARAGENGKGFSVVAEEVGNLAKMSGESADEISKLLADSRAKVGSIIEASGKELNSSMQENKAKINKSIELSNQCQTIFNTVLKNFESVSKSSTEVAVASKEQLIGVEEVSNAMVEISSAANLTNQSSGDVADASQDLNSSVLKISENITNLQILIKKNKDNSLKMENEEHTKDLEKNDQKEYLNKVA